MRLTDTAFVLHTRPWRETSLLVEVLGREQGRLGVIARGVQGPKKHVLRAALQPLQLIRFEGDLRGELARLLTAEALDAAPQPVGDAMLAAFYLNELVLRLAQRHDPSPELFDAYARTREQLRLREGLAWSLRRFERDLVMPDEGLLAIELDGAVGALEVVSLGDLLHGLIHGVVDFLDLDAGRDVE